MSVNETDERSRLVRALEGARRHVLDQVSTMRRADLYESLVPSKWSPLGLVRHLTLSDERYWFEVVVAGGPLDFWPAGDNGDWIIDAGTEPEQVIEDYRHAIANSNRIIAATAVTARPLRPEPEWSETGAFPDLRSILLHNIVETSTHAGQLDVVRELADGGQHIVL
jgi:hypothetical protein